MDDDEQAATESPPKKEQSVALVKLLQVITRAIYKLNLDWPDEQASVVHSKLDHRYLTSGHVLPPLRKLHFFLDFHTEMPNCGKTHILHVFSPASSNYSTFVELSEHGYRLQWHL